MIPFPLWKESCFSIVISLPEQNASHNYPCLLRLMTLKPQCLYDLCCNLEGIFPFSTHTHTHICTCIHWCMQMPLHMHSSILKTCMRTQMHTNPQLTSLNLCLTNLSIQSMTITLWAHVLARTITAHTHYIWDVWIEINQIRKIVTGASASGTKLGLQARTDPTAENAY